MIRARLALRNTLASRHSRPAFVAMTARAQSGRRQRLADDFLGAAEAVDRRRIDDGDALIEGGADRVDRFRLFAAAPHPAAYGPGAEGDARDFERGAGDPGELHAEVR